MRPPSRAQPATSASSERSCIDQTGQWIFKPEEGGASPLWDGSKGCSSRINCLSPFKTLIIIYFGDS
jgi:hypothetical protein